MDKKHVIGPMFMLLVLAAYAAAQGVEINVSVTEGAVDAAQMLCQILYNIRFILTVIAAAVGIIVLVLQGIKWIGSADDPGARKQAKQGIIHAIIGMIIVVLAVILVTMVMVGNYCGTESTETMLG
ncbi:MAG TPA: hypothetical protein ENN13_00645 [Candidatus Altiarchaeales archaeon]|nr:hypothetical protein [Candidatus Altiarchaeales archaeon]